MSDQAWLCPTCGRRVPPSLSRCRCGFTRSDPRPSASSDATPPATTSQVRRFSMTISISPLYLKIALAIALASLVFWLGMRAEGVINRETRFALVMKLFRSAHQSGYDAGYTEGYQTGYEEGWDQMRAAAIDIVSRETPLRVPQLPATPIVIQRSPDEEAILRMQRQRMEREECERSYRQFLGPSGYSGFACR